MRALAAIAVLACALPAAAYDSTCYEYADVTKEADAYPASGAEYCAPAAGPLTARQRWVGGLDEHRRIWETTVARAGLPAEVSRTLRLRVFTGSSPVRVKDRDEPSLVPVAFEEATRAQTRHVSIGELAQLPDFSYALWDWAAGHERCPLAWTEADPVACHDFASHMGPVNANHFLPLARDFYVRYHRLALARARECREFRDALGTSAARFGAYVKECELEALALEAVGQHFLQDAFSAGHMWERWGGPELTDFPGDAADGRTRAVLVALVSGLFHGARSVLQKLPEWTSLDVNDALNAPHEHVQWVAHDGSRAPGLGDDYLHLLPASGTEGAFSALATSLLSCAASGLLQVYAEAGANHGSPAALAPGLRSLDPEGDACFGQRATNEAMLAGAAIHLKAAGIQFTIDIDGRLAGMMIPKVSSSAGAVEVPAKLRNRFRFDVQRIVAMARLRAREAPHATDSASGALGTLLGAQPNGAFAGRTPLASYVDPDLPWPGTADRATPDADERALVLARLFHRAHARDWCAITTAADLEALRAHAADGSLDAEARAAACEACVEIGSRHLRLGTAEAWDTAREPICGVLGAAAPVVYAAGTDAVDAARGWCGCR